MGSRSEPVLVSPGLARRLFHFVMIKPTHYDDDGYPILWYRSAIPSNTLACLNGLAEDAHRRNVLGPDVEIRLHTYDETNRRAQPERIIREIRSAGGKALAAAGVDPASELATQEVFGPVLAVLRVHSFDEALQVADATRFGLSAGIVTSDIARAMTFARRVNSGLSATRIRLMTGRRLGSR